MAASPSEALTARRADLPGRARRARASGRRDRGRDAPHPPSAGTTACAGKLGAGWEDRRAIRLRTPEALAVGGSSTSRSCHLDEGHPGAGFSRAGAASACRSSPGRRTSRSRRDWVCEVLSASTRKVDLQGKRPIYAREGVGHLWLIEPVDRTFGGVRAARGAVGAHRVREGRRGGKASAPSTRSRSAWGIFGR